jgi:hypothetical protein
MQGHKNDAVASRRTNATINSRVSAPSHSPLPRQHGLQAVAQPAPDFLVVHEILLKGLVIIPFLYRRSSKANLLGQGDLGLPYMQHQELSRRLTDQIIDSKNSQAQAQPLPQPRAPVPADEIHKKSTAARHLSGTLAQIWRIELDEIPNLTPGSASQTGNGSLADLAAVHRQQPSSETSIKALVGSKQQAVAWLAYLHAGPNKLMRICSPIESNQLLESLYDPGQTISRMGECLLTWQLACGALFYPSTEEETYTAIYKSAQAQTATCIEGNEAPLLWIVPTLLLECLYLMHPKPRNCWMILG